MSLVERLVAAWGISASVAFILGAWWGHAITLRSWLALWDTLQNSFGAELKRTIREEFKKRDDQSV